MHSKVLQQTCRLRGLSYATDLSGGMIYHLAGTGRISYITGDPERAAFLSGKLAPDAGHAFRHLLPGNGVRDLSGRGKQQYVVHG